MNRSREPDHRSIEPMRNSRDRSPMRELDDKTSNPETVNARLFIGGLSPHITREHLEDHFSRWGNITGITLTKNKFGFIQFEKERDAQTCLSSGYTTVLNGTRLNVKPAKVGMGQIAPAAGMGNSAVNPGSIGNNDGGAWGGRNTYSGGRDHPPPPSSQSQREEHYYDSYYRGENKEREDENLRYGDYYRDYYDRQGEASSNNSSYYRGDIEPQQPPSRTYETPSYSSPTEPLDPLDPMRPNDVEIVVPNKAQRGYAESIEAQLKRLNLLVDLLFPPPDITPDRVITDLSARRCLYAVFATAENENHNSLTLNILHGDPQEHRNMPVDDALRLIQRNFEDYVKQTRQRNMRQVVPRDVRNLLLDLLEMRPLSMGDLDKLIKYLRERQNALVDDQIEQKRETAGTQSSLVAGGMAVTYPGYNYITSTVSGTTQANVAAPPQGILPGGAPPAVAQTASVNLVSSNAAAAAAIAAYPATAYSGLSTTGMIGAYGISQQMAPQSQAPHQLIQGPAPVMPGGPPKQNELQERILNLMKSQQGGLQHGGMTVPSGVPAPTGVPPPSVVPAPRMVQPQQQQPQQMWMTHNPRPNDNADKMQGSQQTYNPWSQ